MPPRASVLEAELATAVRRLFADDRDGLTVNAVRKHVEDKLDLGGGFFKSDKWKVKSKDIITDTVNELVAAGDAQSSQAQKKESPQDTKNGVKRESADDGTPVKKRRKVVSSVTPPKRVKKAESDASDFDETPKKKRKLVKKRRVMESEDDDGDEDGADDAFKDDDGDEDGADDAFKDESSPDVKKAEDDSDFEDKKPKKKQKAESSPGLDAKLVGDSVDVKVKDSTESSPLSDLKDEDSDEAKPSVDDEESELSEVIDEPPKRKRKPKTTSNPKKKAGNLKDEDADKKEDTKKHKADDSDSSLSSVIDEPPKRKRKSKEPAKGKASKPAAEASPDEAEIKKLQGQLVKCGVRKIWGFELKEYGSNAKAKIRHLRGMLSDIGMDGRFSESKAKEIKERRELEADLEAVQTMNSYWGADGGRASRSKAHKTMKEDSGDEDDEVKGDDDGDEDDTKTYSKGRGSAKYKADLAFLGDESESD